MIGQRILVKRGGKDEAEKPFWISFADLMTALMVLFLVVMSVALLAVTKRISEQDRKRAERQTEIEELLTKVEQETRDFPGITIDRQRNIIDFGDRARFETASYKLTVEQAKLLRAFVPRIVEIARDELGRKWLKRIVVEGFTDQRGSYLYNLNLSLQRSERVLCELLAVPQPDERPLTPDELEEIRKLFLVEGYSFNSAKASLDESRRIELRLEFYGVDEEHPAPVSIAAGNFGACALH